MTNTYTDTNKLADKKQGFTLIELLIVMAIIAMLAALVGPRLINALSSSQEKTTRAQIELLSTALMNYRVDMGRYPNTAEGLEALLKKPEKSSKWNGPYLRKQKMPEDGWGNPFHYANPPKLGGFDYDLYSFGADNVEGGEAENSTVANWN